MITLLEPPKARSLDPPTTELPVKELEELIVAMGKRLQGEYLEGAIPYLRAHEPVLWEELEALDREDSLAALLTYERLFFEGLRRYCDHLSRRRKAA
jgi:hypothetical protein